MLYITEYQDRWADEFDITLKPFFCLFKGVTYIALAQPNDDYGGERYRIEVYTLVRNTMGDEPLFQDKDDYEEYFVCQVEDAVADAVRNHWSAPDWNRMIAEHREFQGRELAAQEKVASLTKIDFDYREEGF